MGASSPLLAPYLRVKTPEPQEGIEPSTFPVPRGNSTNELQGHYLLYKSRYPDSNRALLFTRQVLCQISYSGISYGTKPHSRLSSLGYIVLDSPSLQILICL